MKRNGDLPVTNTGKRLNVQISALRKILAEQIKTRANTLLVHRVDKIEKTASPYNS